MININTEKASKSLSTEYRLCYLKHLCGNLPDAMMRLQNLAFKSKHINDLVVSTE